MSSPKNTCMGGYMQAAPKYHLENSGCTRWYKTSNKILSFLVLAYVYVFSFPYKYEPH